MSSSAAARESKLDWWKKHNERSARTRTMVVVSCFFSLALFLIMTVYADVPTRAAAAVKGQHAHIAIYIYRNTSKLRARTSTTTCAHFARQSLQGKLRREKDEEEEIAACHILSLSLSRSLSVSLISLSWVYVDLIPSSFSSRIHNDCVPIYQLNLING